MGASVQGESSPPMGQEGTPAAESLPVTATAPEPVADPSTKAAPRRYSVHAIHLVRTAQINTMTLARMADHKASILLGATFLVFSLSITRALTGQMPVSLTILAAFSFLSSLCAVVAVLPSVAKPKETRFKNLLFFGHFALQDEEEWIAELLERLEEDESVLRTIAHDMYQNGLVLQNKKYRYLAIAYKLFMAGLVLTLAAFALEMMAR